ncbi:tetratricopeptide repeat protein [Legionella saoudiensis]|uniref:tetratricopeptide repeat protein n=1 Tax=Legionella saoudiensis TaxID=1750561 RepID=UPI000731AB73|nr:tetratricopeptide repeat protein [Legionella saoudiensis]
MNITWSRNSLILFLLSQTFLLRAENGPSVCNANQGLALLNQENPPFAQIKSILTVCDKSKPKDIQVLLLHGLLARKEGMKNNQFADAIFWLTQAKAAAPDTNAIPALELAVTYEWSNQPDNAQVIYEQILTKNPTSRPALLGLARTATANNHLENALKIYKKLLSQNPKDADALNGMGRVMMAYKEYDEATFYFNRVLALQPSNADAQIGMKQVKVLQEQVAKVDSAIAPIFTCDPAQGLKLVNQSPPQLLLVQQILLNCTREKNTDAQVLLLQGLNERVQKRYPQAIEWLKKAKDAAPKDNPVPALELAVTYEWTHFYLTAKNIYETLLAVHPDLRPALLGKARIDLWQKNNIDAQQIYTRLLQKNANDVDALNGLARIHMIEKNYTQARQYFDKVLSLEPGNADAKIGLEQLSLSKPVSQPLPKIAPVKPSPCNTAEGLMLVNAKNLRVQEVQRILNYCDKLKPHDSQVALLHGLLARSQKNYPEAIRWLARAKNAAPANDSVPAQELALTYEWSLQLKKAQAEYQELLAKNPKSRPALLGSARVEAAQYHIHIADLIYNQLLTTNPKDVDALNGMGRLQMTNKKFKQARAYFNQALQFSPKNNDSLMGLEQLNNSTRYMASFNQGQYRVLNKQANSSVLYGYSDINATDRVIGIATHNSQQLNLDLTVEPTILPNNSIFLAYQRQLPGKYGWGISYDFRQHNNLPIESRVGGTGNVYLLNSLQWFGGFWAGFPSPWNNQLYFSGLTYYTSLPFNISATGFWANQQIGGQTATYTVDLSKELANSAFYDLGVSYNTTQKFWGYHGRIIWPTFRHQALEGAVEHYQLNNITIFSVGWRVYWG